jgi:hypothetical protein
VAVPTCLLGPLPAVFLVIFFVVTVGQSLRSRCKSSLISQGWTCQRHLRARECSKGKQKRHKNF